MYVISWSWSNVEVMKVQMLISTVAVLWNRFVVLAFIRDNIFELLDVLLNNMNMLITTYEYTNHYSCVDVALKSGLQLYVNVLTLPVFWILRSSQLNFDIIHNKLMK